MATANGVIFKISGFVAYDDGSSGPFEASYNGNDLVSPFPTESADNFDELFGDNSADVNALKNLMPATTTILFGATSRTKTVVDFWMEISGRTSYDDGTSGDFAVQYINSGIQNDLSGDDHYTAAKAVYATTIRSVWREMASTTTVV